MAKGIADEIIRISRLADAGLFPGFKKKNWGGVRTTGNPGSVPNKSPATAYQPGSHISGPRGESEESRSQALLSAEACLTEKKGGSPPLGVPGNIAVSE